MKKNLFLLLLFFSVSLSAQNLKTYFISMPDSIIPLLTKMNREDCIDFLESNMKAQVKNKFGKPSVLEKITDDYLFLQTTPNSSVEMKLLNVSDSIKVIGVIKTYKAKTFDSDIAFYSTNWEREKTENFISLPSKKDFVKADTVTSGDLPIEELNDIMDIPLIKASFMENSNDILFEYTASETLDKEQRNSLDIDREKNTIRYFWTGGRYNR